MAHGAEKTTASKSTDKQAEDGRENRFLQDQTWDRMTARRMLGDSFHAHAATAFLIAQIANASMQP